MKLSAPPPPSPQPNEPGQPAPESPTTVDSSQNPPEPPPAASPPATAGTKPAEWPRWFPKADLTLVLLTLVFAFLVGSFVARNSDIFLHLAAGKRLFAGTYTPGSDPFSFAAADRAWVNHSLFFDIGTYLLYSGNGGTLVVLKAIAVAAAFALVIAIRRPGFSLWPWAAVAAIGVVAAAPYVHLRPNVASMFLLGVTLFLLFRGSYSETSWRFPISIGVVFWVWANTDEWFFLGPMALALVLIGQAIQRGPKSDETGTQEDALGSLPSVKTLARALGIGVVACMLNPHHVRIWELPFELVGSKEMMADIRFKTLLVTPLDRYYVDNAGLGYNANGLAYALLFVGGGLALGLAGSRVRVAHIALWVGFAVLTVGTVYAIPFLALVAVPIIASQVNVLSSNATLTTWGNPRTRFLLLGSAGGRVLSLIVLVVACVLTVPGWIHPGNSSVFARRVGWSVEPEESMVKAAGQLQTWRTSQQLPPESHGFNTSLEFANYCAWFAPDEKVYANSRYNHHLPELPNFLTVRIGMGLVPTDERPNPKVLPETLQKAGVEYVLIHSGPGDSVQFRGFAMNAARVQWSDPDHWSPWYLDGRTTISGWRLAPGKEKPTFAALHVDPVSLAFGPEVERVPPVTTMSVPRFGGWEDAFLRSPGFTPPGVDEVGMWQLYSEVRQRFFGQRQLILDTASVLVTRVGVMFPRVLLPNETPVAVPFLTLRAARRAIAADPNHPDGYFALYRALHEPTLPLSEPERALGQLTALRQCLERMPPPEEYRPNTYTTSPTQVAFLLAELYLGRRQDTGNLTPGVLLGDNPGFFILRSLGAAGVVRVVNNNLVRMPAATQQGLFPPPYYLLALDLARETFQKAENYAKVEIPDPKGLESVLAGIKNEMKGFESELARANNTLESRRAGKSVREQVELALQLNLGNEALRLLTAKDLNFDKEFNTESFEFLLCRVALELGLGKIEDATSDLEQISNADGVKQRLGNPGVRLAFFSLVYQRCLLDGSFAEAAKIRGELDAPAITQDPTKAARDKFNPKPYVDKQVLRGWVLSQLTMLSAPTLLDLLERSCVPLAELDGFKEPGFFPLQNQLTGFRTARADALFRRGVLRLFEGDIPAARTEFLQTRQPAVPEWGLLELRHPDAEVYLRLIDEAEKRSPRK